MGGLCCCLCGEDFEEYAHPSNPIYRHCICLRYFFHQFFSGYMFQRLEGRAINSPTQSVAPPTSVGLSNPLSDTSFSGSHNLVPRPTPYGLVSRRDKSMGHTQEDSQLLSRSSSSSCVEHLGASKKKTDADSEEECKVCRSVAEKYILGKGYCTTGYDFTSAEDEDVCPTCLDEYTPENPKIIAKCSHHFHLGCIYEWMERSEFCPLCGKEMEFSESP